MQVIIGLGSNVGNRERHVLDAVRALEAVPGIVPIALSSAYETAPIGPPQPRYLNAALLLETTWSLEALLAALHGVEAALGRRRGGLRWGPRTLDLDILLAGDATHDGPGPTVPHPRLAERAFALTPLLEVSPEAREPGTGRPYVEVLRSLGPGGVERLGPLPRETPRRDVDHTADRAFSVTARTLAELYEVATLALIDMMFDRGRVTERERRELVVEGDDPSERLVALLGELPFLLDAERFVARRASLLSLDRDTVRVALHGEPLRDEEQVLTAVKAVTHHGEEVARDERGRWRAMIVVDV